MKTNLDKTVVITGAAHGLGKALSIEFSQLGYRLALLDKDPGALSALQASITAGTASVHIVDVSNEEQVRARWKNGCHCLFYT